MYLRIIRHGPKNNDPNAHGTGVEALLDPLGIPQIREYAAKLVRMYKKKSERKSPGRPDTTPFLVETTPVERAMVTGTIISEEIRSLGLPVELRVHELIGSYSLHPETGKAVNLSPQAMSVIWAEAKKNENYAHLQGEHKPLYAWCEQGFDNVQAQNPNDLGISLREIACRLGAYVMECVSKPEFENVVAIGHSGDIEPFFYLTLEMKGGRYGMDPRAMTRHFERTGGALEPLSGLIISSGSPKDEVVVHHPFSCYACDGEIYQVNSIVPLETFQQQAKWYQGHGRSKDMLEMKLKKK